MAPAILTQRPTAIKPSPVFQGTISARGTATGIITHMPAPADEVKLVVLNALGEIASETVRSVSDAGLVGLSFSSALVQKAGKEPYFLMVKGSVKGAPAWEQRLGRYTFHS